MPVRVAFHTLGCKVNQSETDLLARRFSAAGYTCVPFEDEADVYVLNSCTVTHVADKKSRQLLSQARRTTGALVVITGCYASIAGDALAADSTLVVRNRDKDRVLELVEERFNHPLGSIPPTSETEKYLEASSDQVRTRAMVKAQDGCDSHCAYCIIPRARGRSRSTAPGEVIERVRALVEEGHVEVVITGVDLGSYGEARASSLPDLGGLLRRILEETAVSRVRVSSLEPGDFKEEWLALWSDRRMCRHLHVPLQAGSAEVLRRMDRKYTPAEFSRMVATCRDTVPGVTITTDVMAGFPGETDEEFEEGLAFIRGIAFDGMHVFKYSKRSGTRAARMERQVPEPLKAERSRLLREEAIAGATRLVGRHRGSIAEVAWESESEGVWRGLTDTNVRVYASDEVATPGRLSCVRLSSGFRDGLWAEPAQSPLPLVSVPTS